MVGARAAALCININTDRLPIPVEKRLRPCNKPGAPHLLYVAFAICVSVWNPRRCVVHNVTGRSTTVLRCALPEELVGFLHFAKHSASRRLLLRGVVMETVRMPLVD